MKAASFHPNSVVNYKGFADNAPEVIGSNLFGKALFVDLPFSSIDANTGKNPALAARSEALGLITIGLAYYSFDNYPKAEEYFAKAIGVDDWLESDGKELAYLLRGNAITRQASISKDFTRLPEALADYDKAWRITSGKYGRALVGRGGIVYLEALQNPLRPDPKNVDQAKLDEAEKIFNDALALKNQPDSYNIPSKAYFSLGQIYQMRGQILAAGEAGAEADALTKKAADDLTKKAIDYYEKVTQAYECTAGTDPESCAVKNIQEIASFAYARLGLLYALLQEPNYPLAMENYQKSFDISSPYFKSVATFSKGVIQLQIALEATPAQGEDKTQYAGLLEAAQKTMELGVQRAQTLSKQEVIDEYSPYLAYTYYEQGKLAVDQNDPETARQKFQAAEALLTKTLDQDRFIVDDPATTSYEREDKQADLDSFQPILDDLHTAYAEYLATPVP